MSLNPQRGPGMGLPINYPVPVAGLTSGYAFTAGSGPWTLAAGETQLIPAGQFTIKPGVYTSIQLKDPVSGIWRNYSGAGAARQISSDGVNYRLANLTGCAIGAIVTNVGSAYTSAPTVTASAGTSAWTAIVGGAINSTVTITTAGAGYTHPPVLVVSAPPPGGVQATATATVSAGAISAVTVVNQGAGYAIAPTIQIIPDPRDTITTAAVLTVNSTLAGSGTITAILCTDHGTPLTAVPTLTITGGGGASGAATVVMCFAATGITVGAGGAAYGNAQPFMVLTGGGSNTSTPGAVVNPQVSTDLIDIRQANFTGTSTAGGAVTATNLVTNDAGLFEAVPLGFVIAGGTGLATTVAQVTITVGGITDTSVMFPL